VAEAVARHPGPVVCHGDTRSRSTNALAAAGTLTQRWESSQTRPYDRAVFGLFLQIIRAATGGLGGLALGVAINFSFDGQRQGPLTYVGVYAAAGLLFVACGAVWVWIHRRQTRQAPSPPTPVVQPTIHLKLDRDPAMCVRLRRDQPQSVLLEVGIENPNNANLAGVNANVLMPIGLRAGDDTRCDLWGEHAPGGNWAPPTPHRIRDEADGWKEYWNESNVTLTSGSRIFAFKLHLMEPGSYPVLAKFWGGDLPGPISENAEIQVVEGEPSPSDRLSELIYRGEELLDYEPSIFTGSGPPTDFTVWVFEVAQAIPDGHMSHYNRIKDGVKGPKVGAEYWTRLLRADLRALYDIRGRLAVQPALRPDPQGAEEERLLRRQVRRVYSEVDSSRKTVNDALDSGYFWNVGVTGLQFGEWEAARDLLADELPTIHDKVATAYVLVESMNAAANSHRRASRFDERTAEELKRLRAKLREAQDALRAYLEEQEGR
jgi:hypothetical protein